MALEAGSEEPSEFTVDESHSADRLDAYLAAELPSFSRVQLRRAINAGNVLVDGKRTKAAYRLRAGQRVSVVLPEAASVGPRPENIPLDVLFEDEHLVAINKSPDMVVHPSKGHWSGTLTAALAYHFDTLSTTAGPARPGIVHRLDRETSGVIVVAKSDVVHLDLAAQFERRETAKEYFAIVVGQPELDRDRIEQPIGAHPYHRERKAIRIGHATSRAAQTFYEVRERFRGFAALCVRPKTGRTHQIRLHLAHIGCVVLCDRLYGGRSQITRGEIAKNQDDEVILNRQALHAARLELTHPISRKTIAFEAPLPKDLLNVLEALRAHRSGNT